MGLAKPFRALRYDSGRAGRLDELVAPPYDVIGPERYERLLAASPYNAVRLIRPDAADAAARTLAAWRRDGVLVRETVPAVWLLEEDFVGPDGVARTRRSLVARVRLEPYERAVVLPHERSFTGPKEARLQLLRATRTKLSPVLLLHRGSAPPPPPERPPDLVAAYEGTRSRLWRLDPAAAAAIRAPLVVADGHHRYEAALRFHEEDGSEETAYVLAAVVSTEDEGLVVFPTHRVTGGPVPDLNGRFRLTTLAGGAAEGLERLARLPRDRAGFVLVGRERALLAEAAPHGDDVALDTALVDDLALPDVRFTPSAAEAEAAVAAGGAEAAFLVRAPTVAQVEAAARAGIRMPEKTTYFFPKLLSGLLFSPLDE